MRKWNFEMSQKASVFSRLFLVTIITLSLVLGSMALGPRPAQAVITYTPAYQANYDVYACQPFAVPPGGVTITSSVCPGPSCAGWQPEAHFFFPDSVGWPGWLNLDTNTGEFRGCPDNAAVDYSYTAQIQCWSITPHHIPFGGCWWPCMIGGCTCLDVDTFTITFNVHVTNITCMTIDPVLIPWCWEGAPFNMTCTVTGGVGPYAWSAAGLPAGLTMDAAGNITGTPAAGTCNTVNNVTVTVTDTGYCTGVGCTCPIGANRTFVLYVDCWANYIPILFTTITTGCDQTVEIGPGLTQGQTNLVVDGAHVATLSGGQKYTISSVPCEGHTVMVDQSVQPNSSTRFTVIGSNFKTFTETDNYAYFNYAPEVEIKTASDPTGATQPPGAGFYATGSYFSSTVPGTVEDIPNGKKLVLSDWQLPDGTTRPNPTLGYTVNQGGTVLARYKTYYQLTLHSKYPPFNQTSWELAGSTATWNLALRAVPVEAGFWRALGATQSAVNSSGQQVMNGPSTVEIQYKYNYTMPIVAIVILLLVIVGLIFLIRWLRSKPAAQAEPTKAVTTTKKAVTRRRRSR